MFTRDLLNYESLTLKFIKVLRGDITQLDASKKLGYNYNQYTKYEAGIKVFRLSDFIKTSRVLNYKVNSACEDILGIQLKNISDDDVTKEIFNNRFMLNEFKIMDMLHVSKSRAWRLKNGQSELTLEEFFKFLDQELDALYKFLSYFFTEATIDQLGIPKTKKYDMLDLYENYPHAVYILCMCYLDEVQSLPFDKKKHHIKKISKLDSKEFDQIFDFLIKNEFLIEKDDQYETNYFKLQMGDEERSRRALVVLWQVLLKEFHQRLEAGFVDEEYSRRSFKIAPASDGAIKKINTILKKTYQDVSQVIDEDLDSPKTELIYFGQMLFRHLK